MVVPAQALLRAAPPRVRPQTEYNASADSPCNLRNGRAGGSIEVVLAGFTGDRAEGAITQARNAQVRGTIGLSEPYARAGPARDPGHHVLAGKYAAEGACQPSPDACLLKS